MYSGTRFHYSTECSEFRKY